MTDYKIPKLPLRIDLEDRAVLKQANLASRQLAELKGIVHTIPNESILINTLTLQEAKDSSEVENIVTTQDDLYRYELPVLYLSRYITQNKQEYYRLIQAVRDSEGNIVELGLMEKNKIGRSNYYINRKLVDLLVNHMEIET